MLTRTHTHTHTHTEQHKHTHTHTHLCLLHAGLLILQHLHVLCRQVAGSDEDVEQRALVPSVGVDDAGLQQKWMINWNFCLCLYFFKSIFICVCV